jgi:ribosomal protein S18 acetylase RimI-like enzyme
MDAIEANSAPYHLEELTATTPEATLTQARDLLLEYGRFVLSQPGAAQFCFGSLEKEAARLPHGYLEQGGGCLLAYAHQLPAGFIAWREIPASASPGAWELKRLWVRPAARGLSLGLVLTQAVLDRAVAAGRKRVYLDTVPAAMPAAVRLYLSLGFEPCAAYNGSPVEGIAYFVKNL